MKRSEELTPLSHDHHHALEAALGLTRADADTLGAATERFAAYWRDHGQRHFAIEEELLAPALPDSVPGWADACAHVRDDHAEIRAGADRLRGAPTLDDAHQLGERLHDHVRFEEREWFAQLERELPADQLAALGRAVAAAETAGG